MPALTCMLAAVLASGCVFDTTVLVWGFKIHLLELSSSSSPLIGANTGDWPHRLLGCVSKIFKCDAHFFFWPVKGYSLWGKRNSLGSLWRSGTHLSLSCFVLFKSMASEVWGGGSISKVFVLQGKVLCLIPRIFVENLGTVQALRKRGWVNS